MKCSQRTVNCRLSLNGQRDNFRLSVCPYVRHEQVCLTVRHLRKNKSVCSSVPDKFICLSIRPSCKHEQALLWPLHPFVRLWTIDSQSPFEQWNVHNAFYEPPQFKYFDIYYQAQLGCRRAILISQRRLSLSEKYSSSFSCLLSLK